MTFSIELDNGDWITLVLGLAALVFALITLNAQTNSWKRKASGGVTLAIAIVAIGASFLVRSEEGSEVAAAGNPNAIATTSAQITIDRPDDGSIPLCTTLHGSAPEVKDRDLWIAYRRDNPSNQTYIFIKTVKGEGRGRWMTQASRIGGEESENYRYRFYAFYASKEFSHFLTGSRAAISNALDGAKPYPYFTSLPDGVDDRPITILRRNSDNTQCA